MLNITLITIGKIKDQALNKIAGEYLKRISPYARLNITELKAESFASTNKEKAKTLEAERIETVLTKKTGAKVCLLSEDGELFTSHDFARKLNQGEIILVIAGSLGFAKNLLNKYPKISLSPLTFTHEMARVILLEQIYRATTILNNKEYHY